jgi:hypothetical protein
MLNVVYFECHLCSVSLLRLPTRLSVLIVMTPFIHSHVKLVRFSFSDISTLTFYFDTKPEPILAEPPSLLYPKSCIALDVPSNIYEIYTTTILIKAFIIMKTVITLHTGDIIYNDITND